MSRLILALAGLMMLAVVANACTTITPTLVNGATYSSGFLDISFYENTTMLVKYTASGKKIAVGKMTYDAGTTTVSVKVGFAPNYWLINSVSLVTDTQYYDVTTRTVKTADGITPMDLYFAYNAARTPKPVVLGCAGCSTSLIPDAAC
jgi:hypothetical protein